MNTRTTGATAMQPTGNAQGGYWFYSLATGRLLNRNHWTVLPMSADVIARVNTLARTSLNGITFTDRRNQEFDNDIDDKYVLADYDASTDEQSLQGVDPDKDKAAHDPNHDAESMAGVEDEEEDQYFNGDLNIEQRIDEPDNETVDEEPQQVKVEPGIEPQLEPLPHVDPTQKIHGGMKKITIDDALPPLQIGRTRRQTQEANMLNMLTTKDNNPPDLRKKLRSMQLQE